jgi:hypothetical protein
MQLQRLLNSGNGDCAGQRTLAETQYLYNQKDGYGNTEPNQRRPNASSGGTPYFPFGEGSAGFFVA